MTQPPAWCANYIGIPFGDFGRTYKFCDCWGLVRLVLSERAGLKLPLYATSESDHGKVTLEIQEAKLSGEWQSVEAGSECCFDVIEMIQPIRSAVGWQFVPVHVGVVVAPGWLLHTEHATGSLLINYWATQLVRNRIVAFWRHRGLSAAAAA